MIVHNMLPGSIIALGRLPTGVAIQAAPMVQTVAQSLLLKIGSVPKPQYANGTIPVVEGP